MTWTRALSPLALAASLACHGGARSSGDAAPGGDPAASPGPSSGWVVASREDFESGGPPAAPFAADPVPDDGPFSDGGAYFANRGVVPPAAFRATQPFGGAGWLTVESYTRRAGETLADFADVVPDPAAPSNHVLRIRSQEHTDATVIRPTSPLPNRYRVSLRVGFPSFGDGLPGQNGYAGAPTAEPWWPDDARSQNGFYWLAILDAMPRPHVNTWIHHHRKVVVDSDNHYPPWMQIWDGSGFVWSGEHPVMMFALDGSVAEDEKTGSPFLSWSADAWQPSGAIRAVDAYLPGEWYRVTIERDGPRYAIEISGRFRYGGDRTYRAELDAAAACVWHYPATAGEAAGASRCVDESGYPSVGPEPHRWPAGGVWPDWFVLGDPHVDYYEGEVYYDDVTLEVWR